MIGALIRKDLRLLRIYLRSFVTAIEWTDTITARLPKTVLEKAQWEWARKTFLELMIEKENDPVQHMQRGQAASDPEQALAEYHQEQALREEFVRKNPKNIDDSRWLALVLMETGQIEEAIEFFQRDWISTSSSAIQTRTILRIERASRGTLTKSKPRRPTRSS